MSVSLLLVTHNNVGQSLLDTVVATLGKLPIQARAVSVKSNTDPEKLLPELKALSTRLEEGEGVLVLTDMFGSTPSNLAQALQDKPNVRVVAGLNLPMLIRVMNYPKLSLDALAEKAYTGGRDGVVECECKNKDNDE